jgi:hypothetical protein
MWFANDNPEEFRRAEAVSSMSAICNKHDQVCIALQHLHGSC